MNPAKYCEERTRGSGSSFFYAFLFLPEDQRRAIMALYAFCREVDDIADETSDQQVAIQKLSFWRKEINRAFEAKPTHPIGQELNWAKRHFDFNRQHFHDIMDGAGADIDGMQFLKQDDLNRYCYLVAGAVGLLSVEIFGYSSPAAHNFAIALGEALQLTNILRDLNEDASRDRIYIPREDRVRFGVSDQAFRDGTMSAGMTSLLRYYGEKAETCYQQAIQTLPADDRVQLRPSLLMGSIYYAHLQRLRKADFDVWRHPVRILPIRKIWIAWRSWQREKHAVARGRPATF